MLIRKRKDSVELEKVLIEASDWADEIQCRQMKNSMPREIPSYFCIQNGGL